ncbi:MAG: hypothetical protein WBD07_00505 [Vicinamibacterales bacterium]|mgnify:CR=1 FL=1
MTGESASTLWAAAAALVVAAACLWWIWRKGLRFADGDVFRASRASAGNHLFPTQVLITSTGVVQHTPRWIGRREETIHMAHIASVRIETGLVFSDILIETSGGASPIFCHGHSRRDAEAMKNLIERYQTEYYRK